jgi:hypothetical protein
MPAEHGGAVWICSSDAEGRCTVLKCANAVELDSSKHDACGP